MLLTALVMLLLSTLVLGLFGSLAAAEFQAMRGELDAVRFETLRDSALAHGLGMAASGAVPAGATVEFAFDFDEARLYGSVSELTGSRTRPPGQGIYLVKGTARVGRRKWSAQVQLSTLSEPPRVRNWSPIVAF